MENVTVRKNELLDILRANREQHASIFNEALDGYKAEAIRLLEAHLTEVREGKVRQVIVNLPMPEDHTRDYDRAIRMVEMEVADTVVLEESDFQSYVMDDWRWKRQFLASNAQYSSTATQMLDTY